jgi:hypothetical protein
MVDESALATLPELSAARVAVGTSISIKSASWSVTHDPCFRHGKSDADSSPRRSLADTSEGYLGSLRDSVAPSHDLRLVHDQIVQNPVDQVGHVAG